MAVYQYSNFAAVACFPQHDHQVSVPLTMPELIYAVSSLVQDQVRPAIGVLRRRIEELSHRRVECSEIEALVQTDVYGLSGLRLEGPKETQCVTIHTDPPPYSKLKGSIGEGSNHSNFLHQSSVKILSKLF